MRLFVWQLPVIMSLTALFADHLASADDPPKLKTQSVELKDHARKVLSRIELIQLPPGKITLKDDQGQDIEHTIKPIWMGRYETRWGEYDIFWAMFDLTREEVALTSGRLRYNERTRPRKPYLSPHGDGADAYAADCIHFQGALRYCAWLNQHTGKKFRLPTEAEWEYAARAGGPPVKHDVKSLDAFAWFGANSYAVPHPVGKKKPNAWGFYDMLGNVAEYVIRDPKDDLGLTAGGSYLDRARDVHTGARTPYSPDWQKSDPDVPKSDDWLYWDVHHTGFRVVMED